MAVGFFFGLVGSGPEVSVQQFIVTVAGIYLVWRKMGRKKASSSRCSRQAEHSNTNRALRKRPIVHKKLILVVILLSTGLGACIIIPAEDKAELIAEPINETCNRFFPSDTKSLALRQLSFEAPAGWEELEPGAWHGSGPTLLTIFVFDAAGITVEECVDTVLRIISAQSIVDTVRYGDSSYQIAGRPAVIAIADGLSSTGNSLFRGVYAGVSSGDWMYVFAFDANGDAAVSTVTQEAALILGSTVFR